jgi:hypothetical protein
MNANVPSLRTRAPGVAAGGRTTAVHHGRGIHGRSATGATAQVRRDVGRALLVEAAVLLRSVLGVVDVQTTHVELFSHAGW